jgi:type IV pilus assembly protein PilC
MTAAVTSGEIALFFRQLSTLMKSGVPIAQSCEIIADGVDNPTMKTVVLDIKSELSDDVSLAKILRSHPAEFDDLLCSMVESGEKAGKVEAVLESIAAYKEKTEALKSRINDALIYPTALATVFLVLVAVLLLKSYPFITLVAFVLIVTGFLFLRQGLRTSENFRQKQEETMLRLPVIGTLLVNSCIARFSRILATTFTFGIPLVKGLDYASAATGNALYREAIVKIKEDVLTGMQLNVAMKRTGVFPDMVIQMISVGEYSGSLDRMLDKAATYYEELVDNRVTGLTRLVEPIVVSILGGIFGSFFTILYFLD